MALSIIVNCRVVIQLLTEKYALLESHCNNGQITDIQTPSKIENVDNNTRRDQIQVKTLFFKVW